jgi:hypothetical protein
MKIISIPEDFIINVPRQIEGQNKVLSDFMLKGLRIINDSKNKVVIEEYQFKIFLDGKCIKTVSYPADKIAQISKENCERLIRYSKTGRPVKETANKGNHQLAFGKTSFWNYNALVNSNQLEAKEEVALIQEHFSVLEKKPVDKLRIKVIFIQEGQQRSAYLDLSVHEYRNKNKYLFPLRGTWFVFGNWDDVYNHRMMFSQEFAMDFIQLDENLFFDQTKELLNEALPCYGAEVLAIADGIVVDFCNSIPENPAMNKLLPQEELIELITYEGYVAAVSGNYVIIDHGNQEYSFYAHLQPESVSFKEGDSVKQGEVIGLLGNSGHSTGPHLHFHLMNQGSILSGRGLPCQFTNIIDAGGEKIDIIESSHSIIHTK